jgi:hypothetical protein
MEIPMKFFAFCLLLIASLGADSFTLNNETSFQKIVIEWASSARAVQESNESLMQGDPINPSKLYAANRSQSKITIPRNATYFRVLVWQGQDKIPDLLTNWVEIVPNKTYQLQDEHLTPVLLMNGVGC